MISLRSLFTCLLAVAGSISVAGPVRLATSFFIPAGRTNPVILDAKVDANGNLVTAAQADFSGGKQIIITKFNAAGVRRWSCTINTPVAAAPTSQVPGKLQILLDGEGNTYVLSPRAGNPDVSGTTEDLLLRKLNDNGATVGYLSLVRYLWDNVGYRYNVKVWQMQATRNNNTDIGLAITAQEVNRASSVFVLCLDGSVSLQRLLVSGHARLEGFYTDGYYRRTENYNVIGLVQTGTPTAPRMQLVVNLEEYAGYPSEGTTITDRATMLAYSVEVVPYDVYCSAASAVRRYRFGFQSEGLGTSEEQSLVVSRDPAGDAFVARMESPFATETLSSSSAVPCTATRTGDDWLVYGQSTNEEGEFLLKYPSAGNLTFIPYTISDASGAPYYVGNSLTSARGRAFLSGGPTVGSLQGVFSSFNSEGELVYSAGQNQPFTLSTSFVVPAVNNRFWTVGKTSTGLQAVILWREPDYFVGISAPSSSTVGSTLTVKAHLHTPAPTGGYTFNVSVSSNLQNAPRTVTVPAGASSATFTVKVKSTATAGLATVTARTNATLDVNTAHTATLTIQ